MANPNLEPNALLKPGKNGKPGKPIPRYQTLKEQIRTWWNDRLKIGEALREIRDERLYKAEYPNFEDFCSEEFGLKHSQAYGLIAAVGIKESITENGQPAAIAEVITNEAQARALAQVPEEDRVEILTEVAETGPVTARRITEAAAGATDDSEATEPEPIAEPTQPRAPKPDLLADKIGRVVPEEMVDEWNRAEKTGRKIQSLAREIKSIISEGFAGPKQDRLKDPIYAEITNAAISDAEALAWLATSIIPYALCPTCQGFGRQDCGLCRKRGWISRFLWNSPAVSPETKAIIEGK